MAACNLTLDVPGLRGKVRVWRFDQETGGKVVEVAGEASVREDDADCPGRVGDDGSGRVTDIARRESRSRARSEALGAE